MTAMGIRHYASLQRPLNDAKETDACRGLGRCAPLRRQKHKGNFDGKRERAMRAAAPRDLWPWRAVLERPALQFVNSLAAFQR
jgi:hypothetical protein